MCKRLALRGNHRCFWKFNFFHKKLVVPQLRLISCLRWWRVWLILGQLQTSQIAESKSSSCTTEQTSGNFKKLIRFRSTSQAIPVQLSRDLRLNRHFGRSPNADVTATWLSQTLTKQSQLLYSIHGGVCRSVCCNNSLILKLLEVFGNMAHVRLSTVQLAKDWLI